MSIRNRFLAAFVFLLLLLVVINEFSTVFHALNKTRTEWKEADGIQLNTILDLQKRSVEVIAMGLAHDPVIIEAYKQNDPEMIIEDKLAFWKAVKEKKLVYEIHFFKPPAISFVNFSDFQSIGKDVGEVRRDIVWVTSTFSNSQHLMMCKTYAGVRATYPILDEKGKMLGGISLGKQLNWLPDTLKNLTGKEAFLVYTESAARSLAPKYYNVFVADKERVGDYIFAERTLPFSGKIEQSIDFSLETQTLTIDGEEYTLNLYPLRDFNKQIMGYAGVLNAMKPLYQQMTKRLMTDFLLLVGAILLVYFVLRRYIAVLLERIGEIKTLTQALTDGHFERLDGYDIEAMKSRSSGDEIERLQLDVLEMGTALRGYYELLEDRVQQKTYELNEANRRLEHQLYTDPLTELPNRNAFFRDIARWHTPAMALVDINGFKRLNDLYGIETGNDVLKGVAGYFLEEGQHRGLAVYRFGSDEFALVPLVGDRDFEAAIAALLAESEAQEFVVGKERTALYVDLAAGISFEVDHLVETADMALHEAQQRHQEYLVYDSSMGLIERNEQSLAVTETIKNAIAKDRVVLRYQPIFDGEGRVVKHESLVRIVTEEGTVLPPGEFLEFAKRSRYYQTISRIVLEKSFAAFTACGGCAFSINIDADDILNREIVGLAVSLLRTFPEPERVVFEIVETESILDFEEVESFIGAVRALGAKIAIDDFGSGYSNFSYILKLAPDYLKIDGSLIRNIDTDANARAVVRTIVGFARSLGIRTIAEFVHSQPVYKVCKELDIDEFQGYHLSEPLDAPIPDGFTQA